jgi:hypothetical protein
MADLKEKRARLRESFQRVDTDSSGSISPEELWNSMQELGYEFSRAEVRVCVVLFLRVYVCRCVCVCMYVCSGSITPEELWNSMQELRYEFSRAEVRV